ncbi:MAG TPA: hypothetical protein VIE47_04770 [Methylocystis sp.]
MTDGFGSGRPSGSGRDTVEACRSIDVNRLHKMGCLRDGWAGWWQWRSDGERAASINLRAEVDRLPATSVLPRAHWRRLLGGCGGDHRHRSRAVPVWRCPTVFHLPRRRERGRPW